MMPAPLILASASPRRRSLLEGAGLVVQVLPAWVDEQPLDGESPQDYTRRLARDKAQATVAALAESSGGAGAHAVRRWVLGADTVVAVDGALLGKPDDLTQARAMLQRLSGRDHDVVTGFALLDRQGGEISAQAVRTAVRFKSLSPAEISHYLSMGESMDKAGAYAIQGHGAFMVERIAGSYTNVVGLPLCQVLEMMARRGAGEILPY